jgi:hypothetical protein
LFGSFYIELARCVCFALANLTATKTPDGSLGVRPHQRPKLWPTLPPRCPIGARVRLRKHLGVPRWEASYCTRRRRRRRKDRKAIVPGAQSFFNSVVSKNTPKASPRQYLILSGCRRRKQKSGGGQNERETAPKRPRVIKPLTVEAGRLAGITDGDVEFRDPGNLSIGPNHASRLYRDRPYIDRDIRRVKVEVAITPLDVSLPR